MRGCAVNLKVWTLEPTPEPDRITAAIYNQYDVTLNKENLNPISPKPLPIGP